jgi:hypothetical protein
MTSSDPLTLTLSRREREPFKKRTRRLEAVEADPPVRSAGGLFEGLLSLRERNKVRGSD